LRSTRAAPLAEVDGLDRVTATAANPLAQAGVFERKTFARQ
jgi:hypothetical protein